MKIAGASPGGFCGSSPKNKTNPGNSKFPFFTLTANATLPILSLNPNPQKISNRLQMQKLSGNKNQTGIEFLLKSQKCTKAQNIKISVLACCR